MRIVTTSAHPLKAEDWATKSKDAVARILIRDAHQNWKHGPPGWVQQVSQAFTLIEAECVKRNVFLNGRWESRPEWCLRIRSNPKGFVNWLNLSHLLRSDSKLKTLTYDPKNNSWS